MLKNSGFIFQRKTVPERSEGFTLVELLVSLSIVGIILGIVISSISSIQRSSRDAQRQSDLRNIQSALQQFYADHNYYPGDDEVKFGQSFTGRGSNSGKIYLNQVPKDPLNSPNYCYQSMVAYNADTSCSSSSGTCHYYRICAKLEDPGSNPASCTCGVTSTYNFQVTPL